MEAVAATLPPADAVHLRQAFDAHLTDLDAAQGVIRQIPDRVSAALAEPEFSETALREAFAAGRQARSRMDLAIEAALVQAASRMSLEGRQRLSEWKPPRPGRFR